MNKSTIITAYLHKIATSLEQKGLTDLSNEINRLTRDSETWGDKDSGSFYEEISNYDIPTEDARKIIRAFNNGADTEHSVSEVTGISAWTCKKVLDAAMKYRMLN